MAAVELLRDRILDHFEASGGQPLPMRLLRDTVRGLRPHDSEPGQPSSLKATVRLWGELPDTGEVSLEDFTAMLLLWLRRPVALCGWLLGLHVNHVNTVAMP